MDNKLLEIIKYGDHEVLQQQTQLVTHIDDDFLKFRQQMIDTMHKNATAIGLAAPQVGKGLRLTVIDLSMGERPDELLVLMNPEILEAEGGDVEDEGCLSFPGLSVAVKRNTRILLKHVDLEGKELRQEIDGFLARVIQHELDHLDGTLLIDRVSSLKRQFMKKEIKRLRKNGEW
ncbi:MAG: peptide deformylase [bacterium]|nr:peptide deformylase [bacterium]